MLDLISKSNYNLNNRSIYTSFSLYLETEGKNDANLTQTRYRRNEDSERYVLDEDLFTSVPCDRTIGSRCHLNQYAVSINLPSLGKRLRVLE